MTATPCPAHSIIVTVPSGGPCANGGGPAANAGIAAIVANIIAARTSANATDLIMRLMSATSSIAEGGTRQPRPVT